MERLFIFNGSTEELIAVAGGEGMMPVLNAPANEQLNKDFTLQVSVPANHENAVHIKEGNIIGYLDLDGELQAFAIYKTEEIHGGATLEKVAYAEHLFYELLDDVVEDQRAYGVQASEALTKALSASRWQVGTVASLGTGDTNFYYNNALNNVREIVNTYGGELKFRLTYNAGKITGRFVDLLARRGADTGKRLEYTKDISSIKRTVDATDIKTALYGRGASEQIEETGGYTRKADFGGVEWITTNGNPVNKPMGQEWVGDENAKALYGRNNGTRHRYGVVEFNDITDPIALLTATWNYLQTVNKPRLTYEISAIDLERIAGLSHEKVRLGDTVFIIDRDLNLTVEARVIEIERDPFDPANTTIKLGNFIPLFVNIAVELEKVKDKLSEKEGLWDNATAPVTDGDIAIEAPAVPTNVTANGLFENINVKWDFDPSIKVAGYEVFASQINGFTADSSNLVWRGKAGGFTHKAIPNQTWYFKVRAFNPAGQTSALSGQVSGVTAKITGTYIAEATIGDLHIKDVSADKLTAGEIDAQDVNIVNLNVDNVTAGRLKPQFVEIGATTTFASGYDPTKKLQTVFQTTPPTDKNVIWVDTTDPANVQWKVWNSALGDWVLGPSGPRGPQGLTGLQGPKGDQGLQGPAGTSSYTHIAYATSADGTQGFSTSDSTNKTYIGMCVDSNPTDPTTPASYAWTLIKGADGAQGIQGQKGADGQTPYLHIAYATNATGTTGFSTTDATGKTYIGTYTDFTVADSTNPALYTWQKVEGPQGPQGVAGPPGSSLYTWVKYADTATGTGMSDTPNGKLYIGLAYNKTSATESSTASDYTWSLIKGADGAQGPQGVEGPPGDDGVTTYTWIKYADDANGAGMSDSPTNKRYLGLAYNKTTPTESTTATDYSWSPLYDNVVVGGRNLYKDSYLKRVIAYSSATTLTRTEGGEASAGAETAIIRCENVNTTSNFGFTQATADRGMEFKANEPYTISFKARGNVTNFGYTYVMRNSAEGGNSSTGTNPVTLSETAWTDVVIHKVGPFDTQTGYILVGTTDRTVLGKWFEVIEVKVEKGNINTDFTLNPEDVAQDTDDKLGELTEAYTTAISNSEKAITLQVSKTLYGGDGSPEGTGGFKGEMISYTDSKITQTESNINLKFTTVNNTLGAHEDDLAEIYTYFDFSATGLNIGKNDSPLQINISNSQMDFIDNGNIVAYVNGQKMYINTAEILQSIIVGNHKIEKYDNNITLIKWVGG